MINYEALKETMMGMTYEEIEEAVKKNAVVLFPVGVVEAHGPHLPLGTDIIISLNQAIAIKKRFNNAKRACVIAPPFYFGGTQAMTRQFAGTFTSSEEHIVAAVRDILDSLARFGFKRVVFQNAHGDAIQKRAMIRAIIESNKVHEMKCFWPEYEDDLERSGFSGDEDYLLKIDPVKDACAFYEEQPSKTEFDVHAGGYETRMMSEICSDQVRTDRIEELPCVDLQGEERFLWNKGEKEHIDLVPRAYVGDPKHYKYVHFDSEIIYQEYADFLIQKLEA